MEILDGRDIKLSNIKGILIFLVVFGHLMELYKKDFNELFVFIYAFHMPLFIYISGYFAKRVKLEKIMNLLLLYLLFQTLFNAFLYLLGDYNLSDINYHKPIFHLWYIVSMFFWYLLAWVIIKLKLNKIGKYIVFVLIFGVSFMSRWYANDIEEILKPVFPKFTTYTLSYQRSITFAPFFFAGFFLESKHIKNMFRFLTRKLNLLIFLITTFLIFLYAQIEPISELLYRGSFGINRILKRDDTFADYLTIVTFHYFISFVICLLIIKLVQSNKNIFTQWGDNSLTIFLFHPIFVFLLWKLDFFVDWNIATKLMLFFLLTFFINYFLGSNTFVKFTQPICKPYQFIKAVLEKLLYQHNQ